MDTIMNTKNNDEINRKSSSTFNFSDSSSMVASITTSPNTISTPSNKQTTNTISTSSNKQTIRSSYYENQFEIKNNENKIEGNLPSQLTTENHLHGNKIKENNSGEVNDDNISHIRISGKDKQKEEDSDNDYEENEKNKNVKNQSQSNNRTSISSEIQNILSQSNYSSTQQLLLLNALEENNTKYNKVKSKNSSDVNRTNHKNDQKDRSSSIISISTSATSTTTNSNNIISPINSSFTDNLQSLQALTNLYRIGMANINSNNGQTSSDTLGGGINTGRSPSTASNIGGINFSGFGLPTSSTIGNQNNGGTNNDNGNGPINITIENLDGSNSNNEERPSQVGPGETAWLLFRIYVIIKFCWSFLISAAYSIFFIIYGNDSCDVRVYYYSLVLAGVELILAISTLLLIIYLPTSITRYTIDVRRRVVISQRSWNITVIAFIIEIILIIIGSILIFNKNPICGVDESSTIYITSAKVIIIIAFCFFAFICFPIFVLPCYCTFKLLPKYKGISRKVIKRFNTILYNPSPEEELGDPPTCTICMEAYKKGTPIKHLPCGHEFHPECITLWLETNNSCPICRQSFV